MVPIRGHARRWGSYAAIAVAVFCLAAITTQADQAPRKADKSPNSQTGAEPHRSSSNPSSLPPLRPSALASVNQTKPPAMPSNGTQNQWRVTDIVQAISAGLSAVATAALAIFAWRQIKIYQRQTRVMDLTFKASAKAARAAGKSVEAAQRSATAAEDAVARADQMLLHSQKSSRQELRAYVFLDAAEMIVGGPGIQITLRFKNSGLTPAYNARIYSSCAKILWPLQGELPTDTSKLDVSNEPIGPGMTRIKFESCPLAPNELNSFNNGRLSLFVWGVVKYEDAFENEQESTYRYFTGGVVGLRPVRDLAGNVVSYQMSAYHIGNGAT